MCKCKCDLHKSDWDFTSGGGEISIIEAYPVEFTSQPSGKPLAAKNGDDISTGHFQTEESTDLKS